MKKARLIRLGFTLMIATVIILSGCQKDFIQGPQDENQIEQLTMDENEIQNIDDDLMNDVDMLLSKSKAKYIPCNTTIDSITVDVDTTIIYITFSGLNCIGTVERLGKMRIRMESSTNWLNAGASVRVIYDSLKITRVGTGKWILLNGSRKFTNVSGGVITNLGNPLSAIVHRVEGNLNVLYKDSTTLIWNVARQRTFTGTPGNILLTIEGFGTHSTYSNLVVWGVSRQNKPFFVSIPQALVIKEACGWIVCSGVKSFEVPVNNQSATLTFGYDNNNQPVTGNACPTKYKIDWYNNGNSGTVYQFL